MDARRAPIREKARAFGLRLVLAASGPVVATGLGLTVAALIVFSGPDATAKASYESLYGYDRTWNAALRMVRVDMGLKVIEKDESTGYLLFEYKSTESGQKVTSGSMELIRGRDDAPVRVVVQLPQMPHYHEQVLVDALAKKLRQEYGDPPARAPRSEKKPAEDAGAPDASEP
ncbi:MAG: hypothetical protein IPK71_22540 [Myxococcales bacterium]|nr:hypothetical protein [Myxococcales bacterium]